MHLLQQLFAAPLHRLGTQAAATGQLPPGVLPQEPPQNPAPLPPLQPAQDAPEVAPLLPADHPRVVIAGPAVAQLLHQGGEVAVVVKMGLLQAGQLQAAPPR